MGGVELFSIWVRIFGPFLWHWPIFTRQILNIFSVGAGRNELDLLCLIVGISFVENYWLTCIGAQFCVHSMEEASLQGKSKERYRIASTKWKLSRIRWRNSSAYTFWYSGCDLNTESLCISFFPFLYHLSISLSLFIWIFSIVYEIRQGTKQICKWLSVCMKHNQTHKSQRTNVCVCSLFIEQISSKFNGR